MNAPVFSFIVVTYNSSDNIEPCLESIASHTGADHGIVVVDNSPGRETVAAVEKFIASNPRADVRVLKSETNIGFGRACNRGASAANGEYLFLLNPDTELLNDAAAALADCLTRHLSALAAGPALFDSAGRVTRTCRNLPTVGRVILDATGLDRWWGAYKLTGFSHREPRRVQQIIGAAMLIRRTVYEGVGGMDERFFIYFEEVDLCKRLGDSGGEIWFWPAAQVQHLAGQSCEVETVHARMIYTLRDSRRKYFRKHHGALGALVLDLVNRVEALEKMLVLGVLWCLRRKRSYREKALGFLTVALGIAPRA